MYLQIRYFGSFESPKDPGERTLLEYSVSLLFFLQKEVPLTSITTHNYDLPLPSFLFR